MIEYKCIRMGRFEEETEKLLNNLAEEGYRVICSYHQGKFIILERN
ncbi:MAG TPA: hypothetical protein PLG47_04100 [Candidatus Dojkabacteria bacterium]|nr:hypothetical protein [Candidatus Dojkabacteria bacterium]